MTLFLSIFVYTLISFYTIFIIYKSLILNKINLSYKHFIICLLMAFLISFLRTFNLAWIAIVFSIVFYPIFIYLVFPVSNKKLISYSLVIITSMFLLDSLVFYFSKCFNINNTLVMGFIKLLITYFVSKVSFFIKIINNIFNAINKMADYLVIGLTSLMALFMAGLVIFLNINNVTWDALLCILLIQVIGSFLFVFLFKLKDREQRIFVKILKSNNDSYLHVLDESSILKHNMVAKLSSIKTVGDSRVNLVVDEIIRDFNKSVTFHEEIKQIPYGLSGIIYGRLDNYKKKIKFRVVNNVKKDIFLLINPAKYNVLVEKMMILLDNAIDAALNSKNKILLVEMDIINDNLVIEIVNSFSGDIDLDVLGCKSYSTKGSMRGLGLFSALRDKEVNISVKIINNYFNSKIETPIDHYT